MNVPITSDELQKLEDLVFNGELGTKEDFINNYGNQPLGKFVREILGLDIHVANEAFAQFLQNGNLKAHQQKFIQTIIDYLNTNGVIDKSLLFEAPFNYVHDDGLTGVFQDNEALEIIQIISKINENAGVA